MISFRGALSSFLHFFVVFSFLGIGLFFIALPHLPLTRMQIIEVLSNRPEGCIQVGFGFLFISLIFFLGFFLLNRGKYLVVRMGVSTDLKIIRHAVEDCFAKQFPKKISLKGIEIGPKQQLGLIVGLAPTDEALREELFVEVEKELGLLLQNRFGYSQSFHLIVKQ